MIYKTLFQRRLKNRAGSPKSFVIEGLGVLLNIVLLFYLYQAIYDGRENLGGIAFSTLVTYLVVARIIRKITEFNGTRIAGMVNSGKMPYEMLKPYSFSIKTIVEAGADFCVGILFIMIPIMILAGFTIGLEGPVSMVNGILGILSLLLGVGVWWGIRMVIQMFGFWFRDMLNVFMMVGTFYQVFLGGMIPYWFLPEGLVKILMCTPCGYVLHMPMEIYFGYVTVSEALLGMMIQCVWILILAGVAKKMYAKGKCSVQAAG